MLKAVLFDLDNTLLLFDEMRFFQAYMEKIHAFFSDLMEPAVFRERLLSGSQYLMRNNGRVSNADFYMDHFALGYESIRSDLWQRFMDFYELEYDQFASLTSIPKGGRDLLLKLKALSLKIIIASNPLWPLTAQLKRLEWAGIGDIQYDLITHIENMSYCKPRLEYYKQICRMIDAAPESCLMVGNDPVNDMAVAQINMHTYLTLDYVGEAGSDLSMSRALREGFEHQESEPDFRGPLVHVIDAVQSLLNSG